MATQYSHPLADAETTEELADAFTDKFQLEAENHEDTVTVPLEVNWTADDVLELIEDTPFKALSHDEDEVTLTKGDF